MAAAAVAAWGAFLAANTSATAIMLGVPAGLAGVLVLVRRPLPRQVIWSSAGVAALSLALYLAQRVVPQPLLVLAVPAGVAAGIACRRRPQIAILALFAVASGFGVIDAFTPIPPSKLTDLLLAGLWLGVVWRWIAGGKRFELRLLPGVVLLLAFAVITLAQVIAAPSLSFGIHTFISTGLYLLTVVLVGASDLDSDRLATIGKGSSRSRCSWPPTPSCATSSGRPPRSGRSRPGSRSTSRTASCCSSAPSRAATSSACGAHWSCRSAPGWRPC